MTSYYAACDCGWTGKRRVHAFTATEEARLHTDQFHRVPPISIFSSSEEPN